MSSANVIEVFSSVQGEGKYLGFRQIFVRLADCNLNCAYCDTNFFRADFFAEVIKNFFYEVPTQAVSFTGGEPLLHWKFIGKVASAIKSLGMKVFLETNGTLPDELEKISDAIDIVSMDIKLPSVVGQNLFDLHKKFLLSAQKKDLYVKIVVTGETTLEEFLSALDLIANVDAEILLILQPVTPLKKICAVSAEKILSLQAVALRKLKNVRVIPQTHRLISVL